MRVDLIQKKTINNIDKKNYINIGILFLKAVAELFLEKLKVKTKKNIIHKDFNKLNNHVDNLVWASRTDLNKRVNLHPKVILN